MKSASVLACFFAVAIAAACSSRGGFDDSAPTFQADAATEAGACLLQCSLDARSVVDCTGKTIATCPDNQACGAATCQDPCAAAAADRSSNGCDFFLQPPVFTKTLAGSCYAAYVVNASTQPANLALELQGKPLDVSRSVYSMTPGSAALKPHTGPILPGESTVLFVSDHDPKVPLEGEVVACPAGVTAATIIDALPDGTGFGDSFHLTSDIPVGLAAIYPYGGAASFVPSATLLLPVPTWGTQHFIINAWEQIAVAFYASNGGPAAQIVASEDDTDVTIRPTHDIQDGTGVVGTAAFVPTTYHLKKGQLLQINQAEELSGSFVTSTKPTSVFGGHECMFVPATRDACDIALQQIPPFAQWGSEYAAVGYRPRTGNEHEIMPYRIMAARDGTRLDYDPALPPGAPTTMSAGQVVTFYAGVGDAFVVRTQDADHPIYLAAFMAGGGNALVGSDFLGNQDLEGNGDPEFVNVIPSGQYLSSYSFFADPTFEQTSLVVIRARNNGKMEDVWLECAGQNLADWKPIGTRGDYEYVRVDLIKDSGPGQAFGSHVCTSGLQRMHSAGAFTSTIWGWASYASYAYPGGTALRRLVPTPLPDVR